MSGGHITGYHSLPSIAEEIERLAIEQPELGPDVLGRYRLAAEHARRAYEAIRAVDYLEGGEYGRESFVQAWGTLVVDPASALRAEVQRLQRERDAAIDERNAWRSGDQDSRIEADRLRGEVQRLNEEITASRIQIEGLQVQNLAMREEARRSDAGRVEVPELLAWLNAKYVTYAEPRHKELGLAYLHAEVGDLAQELAKWLHARLSPSPQPSADVVVVPREEWTELLSLEAKARVMLNYKNWSADRACAEMSMHEPIEKLDALRSSTNHDAQDAGEGR